MIKYIENKDEKALIAERVLSDLPEWFGIESATKAYIEAVRDMVFMAYDDVAFLALAENPVSYDMHVLGVLKAHHRKGIGHQLIQAAEAYAKKQGKKYMTVKTLSADHPDANYKKTRLFYESMGYEHLEIFKDLWGEENPCLYMIKTL